MDGAQLYSHVLPSPQAKQFAAAASWAEIGPWPATPPPCVDPITGEGLYYALRSGDLLAQALVDRPAANLSGALARRFFRGPGIRREHRARKFSAEIFSAARSPRAWCNC